MAIFIDSYLDRRASVTTETGNAQTVPGSGKFAFRLSRLSFYHGQLMPNPPILLGCSQK